MFSRFIIDVPLSLHDTISALDLYADDTIVCIWYEYS